VQRRTYRAEIAYDGGAFGGYQRQPGLRTVESTLIDALSPLAGPLPAIPAGARTDRGVHATAQVVSFWSRFALDLAALREAIDRAVPEALVACDLRAVPRWFHARASAVSRRYVYLLDEGGVLDAQRIDRMLLPLIGRRCFGAFARDLPAGARTVTTLADARARRTCHLGREVLRFDFAAASFLRRQVRVMVATAARECERGAPENVLLDLALSGDRSATAPPAPPGGLYLVRVGYG